jgi:hypothetical protein
MCNNESFALLIYKCVDEIICMSNDSKCKDHFPSSSQNFLNNGACIELDEISPDDSSSKHIALLVSCKALALKDSCVVLN